jgi:hypothetical protein
VRNPTWLPPLLLGIWVGTAPALSTFASQDPPQPLEQRVADLEIQLKVFQTLVFQLIPRPSAKLDCASQNFSSIGTSSLPLFVACERIEPYLEGHKVTFKVGNPFNADLKGLRATLSYARPSCRQSLPSQMARP